MYQVGRRMNRTKLKIVGKVQNSIPAIWVLRCQQAGIISIFLFYLPLYIHSNRPTEYIYVCLDILQLWNNSIGTPNLTLPETHNIYSVLFILFGGFVNSDFSTKAYSNGDKQTWNGIFIYVNY